MAGPLLPVVLTRFYGKGRGRDGQGRDEKNKEKSEIGAKLNDSYAEECG